MVEITCFLLSFLVLCCFGFGLVLVLVLVLVCFGFGLFVSVCVCVLSFFRCFCLFVCLFLGEEEEGGFTS